jgi:CelD/BcsL family acetyltransferase involved in cellulose biosynthesis
MAMEGTMRLGPSGQPGLISARGATLAVPLEADCRSFRTYSDIASDLEGLEGTPFQSAHWLSAWLDTFATDPAIEPHLITLRDGAGVIVFALPIIRYREGALRVIEIPDLGVTDYAAPLLRRDRLVDLPAAPALLDLMRRAMPPADLLRLNRLCPLVAGMPNPLHDHPAGRRNRISGWLLNLPQTPEAYHSRLGKAHRETLGKYRRRFAQIEGSEAYPIEDVPTALAELDHLDRMQEARVTELGKDYHLNQPRIAAFYRRLVETGIASRETLMCRFAVKGETLAVNFAVRAGERLVYLRLTNAFGEWARFSLGTLVTDHMIRASIGIGVGEFDFAMGDYEYKRRFGAKVMPLHNLVLPLSARGWPAAALWHLRDRLARSTILRRLTGREATS